jgi:hypothetical protein
MNGAKIQGKVWRGYGISAKKIGFPYTFYRLGGGIKYNSGLTYDSGLKYGTGGNTPDRWDTPGTRWDKSGNFDQQDTSALAVARFDTGGALWDSGANWDDKIEQLFTLPVSLNAEDMKYSRPNKYGKATWYALFDGSQVNVGDYFVGPEGTFFVAAMQALLPILVVQCNRTISLYKPQAQSGTGLVGYGGTTATGDSDTPPTVRLLAQGLPCSILQGTKGEKSEANLPGDTRSPWWQMLMPDNGLTINIDDVVTDDLGRRYIVSSPEKTDLGHRITLMSAVP